MPASDQRAREFRGDVAGRGFERGLGPGTAGDEVEERAESVGCEIAGGAAAEVDGVGSPVPLVGADFASQGVEIGRLLVARKDSAGEIAVGTLLRAERV